MKTMISLKADTHIKRKAQAIAEDMGLTLSALVNAFLHEVVKKQKATFSAWPVIIKTTEAESDGYSYDERFLKKLAQEAHIAAKAKRFRKLTSLKDLE